MIMSSELVLIASFAYSMNCTAVLYCRTRHTAQNEFETTRTSTITPRCSTNELIWYEPRHDHVISFKQSKKKSFSICLSRDNGGMSIYQLRGTSRKLLVRSNSTGELGCFESECKHLTLLFEVDSSLSVDRFKYSYRSTVINSE